MEYAEATYCPEDNKIRLYCGWLEREAFEKLRACGYKPTPKQSCDFVATWSVRAEDAALEMLEEGDTIGDEDQSPEDRAADRAERFAGYRDKRSAEAHGHADSFEAGPSVHGHQNAQRAERAAARHDRQRVRALNQWDKAEYWQRRTEGVIGSAIYKAQPAVRRGRIKRLEAELRKAHKDTEKAAAQWDAWKAVADEPDAEKAAALARFAYNHFSDFAKYQHPRDADRAEGSLYWLLSTERDPITPHEAADLFLGRWRRPEPGRYHAHLTNRIAYERQMIGEQGGMASEADIVPGGWFGSYQVVQVHKSNASGAVVSVSVVNAERDKAEGHETPQKRRIKIERLGESAYRAPTPEDVESVKAIKSAMSAATKAKNAGAPKLINPTPEDAAALVELLNNRGRWQSEPAEVVEMTQAEYSARSKGTYSSFSAEFVHTSPRGTYTAEKNPVFGGHYDQSTVHCKVRTGPHGSVVILTDKPQKALPLDAIRADLERRNDWSEILPKLPELHRALAAVTFYDQLPEEHRRTFEDARERGLVVVRSMSQWTWSAAAAEAIKKAAPVTA